MEIYLVGGAVRDKLLGLPVKERDWVVTGATPEEMIRLGFRQVGRDFPVFLHPETGEEYALARTERKTGPGYTGFSVDASPAVSLVEDLRRRDLTINAMAQSANGTIIDPWGGQEDLREGRLRHVSPAFAEDPLRILRVARFAARYAHWGFRVAHGTSTLMRRMVDNGEVDHLVAERVWTELIKALAERHPERFFEVLRGCGALSRLFPEIDRLIGTPRPRPRHPEIDAGDHVLQVLRQAAARSNDTRVRFAALVHNLGEGDTPQDRLPRHHGHEQRSARLVQRLCERLKAPNEYRDLAVLVARHHRDVHRALELRPSTVLDLLQKLDAFRRPQRFERFLIACEAVARGRSGRQGIDYPQAAYLRGARETTAATGVNDLSAQRLGGAEIGRELRRRRLAALRVVREKH
jgi:tRNA nucleotidyltransferase (CCA-adding enzyme)